MKKVILLLFSGLGCLMFMGSVKALTFEKIIDVYKENVLNNEIFKESSDKISFTNTENSITAHVDFSDEELSDLAKLDVVFNYSNGLLKYSYDGELNDEVDESKYLLNTLLANIMYYTVGDLNGYSEKQMQNTLTEDKTKSFTLEKNGIEINLLKYEKSESGAISGGVYFTKSFNLDLNKFNIGEKKDHAVYLEYNEVFEQLKKDYEANKDMLGFECSINNAESSINITCSKNEMSTEFAFKYSGNLITYELESSDDFNKATFEMVSSNFFFRLLINSIGTLNKYSDNELEEAKTNIYQKVPTLNDNGIEYTLKTLHNEESNQGITVDGTVELISNFKVDLDKFNLDNLLNTTPVQEVETGEKCSEKDGKYFDKNGNSVSKEAYFESCGVVENPKTGLMIPLIIFGIFGLMGISLIVKRKTYFEKI